MCGIFTQQWLTGPPQRRYAGSTLGSPLPGLLAEYVAIDENGLSPYRNI
ncbi:hypothetical protein [Paenibacillus methanolicus]|nr:hypothetical protein [Paenibacillus methanolicus]